MEDEYVNLKEEEKKQKLYEKQVEMLKLFLSRGAITEKEYLKSYNGLTEKMGMKR